MESFIKWLLIIWGAFMGLVLEVQAIMIPCLVLISIDFILGICTDFKSCKIKGDKFGLKSGKAWKSVTKLGAVMLAILVSHYYSQSYMDWLNFDVGKTAAGVIAGIELFSIFGHLTYLTGWYAFDVIKKIFQREIEEKTGTKISDNEDKSN